MQECTDAPMRLCILCISAFLHLFSPVIVRPFVLQESASADRATLGTDPVPVPWAERAFFLFQMRVVAGPVAPLCLKLDGFL
jgi:hypothetical protein